MVRESLPQSASPAATTSARRQYESTAARPLLRMAADSAAALVAFTLAYAIRQWGVIQALRFPIQPLPFYLPLVPVALGLLVLVFWQHGLYRRTEPAASLLSLTKALRAVFVWLALLMALSYLAGIDPSRALLLLGGSATLAAIAGVRALTHILERTWLHSGDATEEVIILDRELSREAVLNIVAAAGDRPVRFRVGVEFFPLLRGSPLLADPSASTVTLNLTTPAQGLWICLGKRLFDTGAALLALPAAVSVGLLIALAIRLDSPGPVLFHHDRSGFRGRPFRLLKFRTMVTGTPALADAPRSPDDVRITRVGRWLRRWSLDELPQLWNVLRGDMSLVGPRPEMPHLVAQYAPWQQIRLRVRPGLTGLWQVLGRKKYPLHEHLEYDIYYAHNVSLSLDLAILLKTIPSIVSGRGAY